MTKELSLEVSYTLLIMCPSQQTEKKNRLWGRNEQLHNNRYLL
jgi:hypothetical protein